MDQNESHKVNGLSSEIQLASTATEIPDNEKIQYWLATAFPEFDGQLVLVRIVDEAESTELNQTYRNKTGPTNILSFPLEVPAGVPAEQLGDLVICAPVTCREAEEQDKPVENHYCHLLIHGVLHLTGYDHQNDAEATHMESREVELLKLFNIPNPYHSS